MNMKNNNQKGFTPYHFSTRESDKGFTLLLAALIASIVLSLGGAIFSIAQKELALSSVGRNSQFAFYAADTAAECALYWDVRAAYFATSSDSAPYPHSPPLTCAQTTPPVTLAASSPTAATSTFTLSALSTNCAIVLVAKSKYTDNNGIVHITNVIHADGFSTSCGTYLTDPQALERSVELHY